MNTNQTNPAATYDAPTDVLRDKSLSLAQKADILETWEANAIALQRAASEGMDGGEPSKLREVCAAKRAVKLKQKRAASNHRGARVLGALALSVSVAALLWWVGGLALATVGLVGTFVTAAIWPSSDPA